MINTLFANSYSVLPFGMSVGLLTVGAILFFILISNSIKIYNGRIALTVTNLLRKMVKLLKQTRIIGLEFLIYYLL